MNFIAPSHAGSLSACVLAAVVCVASCGGGSSTAPLTAQTIDFPVPNGQILGRTAAALAANASSGLAVTFSSATAPICTVSGTTLTPVAAGNCTINADQAGNGTYAPAPRVTVTFAVLACASVPDGAGVLASFDDASHPFTVVGFNGDAGAVAADPTGGCNTVGSDTRSVGSQFDGVTFGTLGPASNPTITAIPFTAITNTLTLRVYVPTANTLVHLKVENAANGTLNYETEVTAPLANAWQTLTFHLNAPLVGGLPGQAFNLGTTYNRVSVFFGFGGVRTGTATTYYFDDLKLLP